MIAYVLTVLNRHKRALAAVFVVLMGTATAYTLTAPKKYESRMKVLVKNERADPMVTPETNSPVIRAEVSESDVNSEIELLTSSQILREVALRNGLARRGDSPAGQADSGESLDLAVRRLRTDLTVSPARKASIIQVSYAATDPERSVAVLTTLAALYLEMHLTVHRTAGAQEFFKQQAADYEQQLAAAQKRLATLRQRNDVVLLTEQKDLMVRRVVDMESSLTETGTALEEASAKVATLRHQLAALQPRVVTQSRVLPNQYSIERLNTMLAEMRNRRSDLLVKFKPDDRMVRDLDKQIEETTGALAKAQSMTSVEETTDVNPLRQSLDGQLAQAELQRATLAARRTSLTSELREWRSRLQRLDSATVEHERLARDVKRAEDKLVLYGQKQEEARIADALDQQKISNVSIAEAPVRPYLPSSPNVPLNLALGFVVALFASLGTAFALEVNRTTFESETELETATGLPVLASIPAGGA